MVEQKGNNTVDYLVFEMAFEVVVLLVDRQDQSEEPLLEMMMEMIQVGKMVVYQENMTVE